MAKKPASTPKPRKTAADRAAEKELKARDQAKEEANELEQAAIGAAPRQNVNVSLDKPEPVEYKAPEVGSTAGALGAIDAPKTKRLAHDVSDKETGLAEKFHREMDEQMATKETVGIHTMARLKAEQDPMNASEEDRRRAEASKRLGVNVFPRDADEVDLPTKAE